MKKKSNVIVFPRPPTSPPNTRHDVSTGIPTSPPNTRHDVSTGVKPEVKRQTLSPEQQDLLLSHLHLVSAAAARVCDIMPPSIEYDDLFQAGALGAMRAIQSWDATRGSLKMWLDYKVRGFILDSVKRREYRHATCLPLCEAITAEAPVKTQEYHIAWKIADAVKTLTVRERRILRGMYWEGKTTQELAFELGTGPSNISRIHRIALSRLAPLLSELSSEVIREAIAA